MNTELLSQFINAIVHPVVAVDQTNMIVAANKMAKKVLGINSDVQLPVSFGTSAKCYNAQKYGKCGSTVFCEQCQLSTAVEYLFDNHEDIVNKKCVLCTLVSGYESEYLLHFSASYLEWEKDELVLLTLNSLETFDSPFAHLDVPPSTQAGIEQASVQSIAPPTETRKIWFDPPQQEYAADHCVDTFLNHCTHGVILLDNKGNLVKANRQLIEMTGLTLYSIIKRDQTGQLLNINPEFQVNGRNAWQLYQSLPTGTHTFNAFLFNHNKTPIKVSVEAIPVQNAQNIPVSTILMLVDKSDDTAQNTWIKTTHRSLEHAPGECFFVRRSGVIEYANLFARDSYGWSEDYNKSVKIFNIVLGHNIDWWTEQCDLLNERGILQFETAHMDLKGHVYPVSVLLYFIQHDGEDLICYFATDISEQKKNEGKIYKELKINNSFSEISKELTFSDKFASVALLVRQYAMEITDSEFCFLSYFDPDANDYITSIYSDSEHSYKGEVKTVADYLSDFYQVVFSDTGIKRNAAKKILNDSSTFNIASVPINQFLPFPKMAWAGVFFHDDFQGLLFVAGKEDDYTDDDLTNLENLTNLFGLAVNRIQEKSKLLETNELLSLAMEVAQMGMFEMFPLEDNIRFSPQLNKLLGGLHQELSLSLTESLNLVHPDDKENAEQSFLNMVKDKSSSYTHTTRMAYPGNQYRWYQITAVSLRQSPEGIPSHVVGVQLDITDQMALNDQLRSSREEAIAANNAKSAFLARISHELRTPLNAIIGFTDLLTANVSSPTQLEYLLGIKKSGHTLMDLINDVLDFSKIEAGKLSLSPAPTNLSSLIRDIRQLFSGVSAEKHLDFILDADGNLPQTLIIDELRVKQVLINLIGNAVKFTEHGFIKLTVKSDTKEHSADLSFSVEDSGIGIKQTAQATIFNDFTQQEDQDNRRYGGTGLGLGIVKRLVNLMGGSIELVSEPDKGSRFTVILPNCALDKSQESPSAVEVNGQLESPMVSKAQEEINGPTDADIKKFVDEMGDIWSKFVMMPSFKSIDEISTRLQSLSERCGNNYFSDCANRLINCKHTFNVVELNNTTKEMYRFTGIGKPDK